MGKKNMPSPLSTGIDERYSQTIPQIMPLALRQSIDVRYLYNRQIPALTQPLLSLFFAKAGRMLPADQDRRKAGSILPVLADVEQSDQWRQYRFSFF
jgi:hypothetical protein